MEEPSVLDYVKAKLTFWKKSDLHIPDPDETAIQWPKPVSSAEGLGVEGEIPADATATIASVLKGFPWLVVLPLLLTLLGQCLVEPPARASTPAAALYGIAALLAAVGIWRKQFVLPEARPDVLPDEIPEAGADPDDLRLPWMLSVGGITLGLVIFLAKSRSLESSILLDVLLAVLIALVLGIGFWTAWYGAERLPAIKPQKPSTAAVLVGLVLILFSFLILGGNRFNTLNFAAWLATMLVSGLLVFRIDFRAIGIRWKTGFSRPLSLQIGGFTVLLVLALVVIAFFRFYDLNGLPGEMFSDHAEKLLDVNDLMNGQLKMFFERNTGREMFQFYWTALMGIVFDTGISFLSLKIGTALVGLVTLYYIYRLGNELGGKWVALYALFLAGIAYWPNIISRIGLRFPLYPFCVAPVLFYLLRGLRRQDRNDFVWGGIWLGIGLHGYTASRIVPLLVAAGFALFLIHKQSQGKRKEALAWLAIFAFVAFVVFLPLFRYAMDNPEIVSYRSLTRLESVERPLDGSPVAIFFSNTWNALAMFFWDNGDVWVHSVPHRPALGVVDAALFFCGMIFLLGRYVRRPHWRDLFLLVSIPILLLPSILSLAFPNENPNLNRTAGAYVPVFIITAIGLDVLLQSIRRKIEGRSGLTAATLTGLMLALASLAINADLFFNQYASQYRQSAWNTSELGQVMGGFARVVGTDETSWVVGYPYWVDTRLVAINAGFVDRNPEIMADQLDQTLADPRPKLFLLNTADTPALDHLRTEYPQGRFWLHPSTVPGKDFLIFMVSSAVEGLP